MQSVSSDHQVESTPAPALEIDVDTVCPLLQRNHFIAKDDLGLALDGLEQEARKIAPPERYETAAVTS
jgi:hypothetical protein